MHALMAYAYHLLLLPIHLAARPGWRSLGVCLALAIPGRLSGLARGVRGAMLAGGVPVVGAWAALAPMAGWPLHPVARLAGLGAILLAVAIVGIGRGRPWLVLSSAAALGGWWLGGAPADLAGLADCIPVFVGLVVCYAVLVLLTQDEPGWGVLGAAMGLAAGLLPAGAAPHWAYAALVPGCASAVFLRVPGAMPILAGMTVSVAMAALLASDQGRVVSIDIACAVPLLVLAAAAWLRRPGPATRL